MIQGIGYDASQPNAPTPQTTGSDNWESIFSRRDANARATQQAEAERKKAEAEAKKKDTEKIGGLLKEIDYTGILATDTDVVKNAISDIYKTAYNTEVPFEDLEDDLYMKAAELKFFIGKSKEQAKALQDLQAAEIKGERIGARDVIDDVLNDNISIEAMDEFGMPVSKALQAKDVSTFDDMKNRLMARDVMFQKPFTPFNIPLHLQQIKSTIENPVKTEVDLGNGQSRVTILDGAEGVKARLENAWNDPALQRQAMYDFEQAKKSPNQKVASGKMVKDIKNAKEFFVESYYPSFTKKDVTLEGSEKYDKLTNLGGNKARIGDTIVYYYNDGKGTETIDISGVRSKADNPVLNLVDDNGNPVKARPARWVLEKGKTPYLEAEAEPTEEMKKSGFQGSWFSVKIPYNEANKGNLKYVDPFTVKETLGVTGSEGNQSAKTNVSAGNQGAKKMTQAEWNAEWAKLKKGETMVGLNGVTYTKK